ncbi:MAG: hypothetical protein PVF87_03350 [Acidimicrobiia bacterium]|jgi:hypothetical protein
MLTRTALIVTMLGLTFVGTLTQGVRSAASLTPHIAVGDASPEMMERLREAVARYTTLGLALPDLEVVFHPGDSACGGAKGRFNTTTEPWRISICTTEVDAIFEHELAHAWERANLGDALRQGFMDRYGYDVWRSQDVPWNERAVERMALVVQQGVSGLPLPPALGSEAVERLEAFEFLTGIPDPRLESWMASKPVECRQRPTPLSSAIPDAAGVTCA